MFEQKMYDPWLKGPFLSNDSMTHIAVITLSTLPEPHLLDPFKHNAF